MVVNIYTWNRCEYIYIHIQCAGAYVCLENGDVNIGKPPSQIYPRKAQRERTLDRNAKRAAWPTIYYSLKLHHRWHELGRHCCCSKRSTTRLLDPRRISLDHSLFGTNSPSFSHSRSFVFVFRLAFTFPFLLYIHTHTHFFTYTYISIGPLLFNHAVSLYFCPMLNYSHPLLLATLHASRNREFLLFIHARVLHTQTRYARSFAPN